MLGLVAAPAHPADAPVMMEAVGVEGNYVPKLCFGISLNVWKDNNTHLVTSIIIDRVKPGSEAEQKGLAPMARVLRINGRAVQEIEASFFKGKELNQVFVDRRDGDKITLEIWMPGETEARTVVLTEHNSRKLPFAGPLERFER